MAGDCVCAPGENPEHEVGVRPDEGQSLIEIEKVVVRSDGERPQPPDGDGEEEAGSEPDLCPPGEGPEIRSFLPAGALHST